MHLDANLKELLGSSSRLAITFHENPDGDAIGSALGLHHLLESLGYQSLVISPNLPAQYLRWLPGIEQVLVFEENPEKTASIIEGCDAVICLDFNDLARTGNLEPTLARCGKPLVRIDHHPNPKGFESFSFSDDKAAATAQLIMRLSEQMEWLPSMNQNAAMCLYTGIMTDTGSFRFPSVTAEIHLMAAKLLETGIEHNSIHNAIYDTFTENRLRFYGFCFNQRLEVLHDRKAAIIWVTATDLEKYKVQKGDTEGLVNCALGLVGIKLGVLVIDRGELVKLSFRSKGDVPVNQLASEHFEGGGHKNAAGGKSYLPLEDTLNKLKSCIYEMHVV